MLIMSKKPMSNWPTKEPSMICVTNQGTLLKPACFYTRALYTLCVHTPLLQYSRTTSSQSPHTRLQGSASLSV